MEDGDSTPVFTDYSSSDEEYDSPSSVPGTPRTPRYSSSDDGMEEDERPSFSETVYDKILGDEAVYPPSVPPPRDSLTVTGNAGERYVFKSGDIVTFDQPGFQQIAQYLVFENIDQRWDIERENGPNGTVIHRLVHRNGPKELVLRVHDDRGRLMNLNEGQRLNLAYLRSDEVQRLMSGTGDWMIRIERAGDGETVYRLVRREGLHQPGASTTAYNDNNEMVRLYEGQMINVSDLRSDEVLRLSGDGQWRIEPVSDDLYETNYIVKYRLG